MQRTKCQKALEAPCGLVMRFALNTSFSFLVCWTTLAWKVSSLSNSQQPFSQPTCVEFNPYSYSKDISRCSAVNRHTSQTVEIDIHYVDINPTAETTLLFVHGWPGLWSTWSNQIQQFERNYRLIVPDLRGFGASTHPGDVESSGTMADMIADLACVLNQAAPKHKAVCIGHDWGSQVCWEAARMRPDLIQAVAGVVVPYIAAAGPFVPIEQVAQVIPKLKYQIFFEKYTSEAVLELNESVRRSLRATYRSATSPAPSAFLTTRTYLEGYKDVDVISPIPFMSPVEEDYLVEQYRIQGFEYSLQFYTHGNRYGTWALDHRQGNLSIPQPALFIPPTNDSVANWLDVATLLGSASFFHNLSVEPINSHHWPQLEEPLEFNRILQTWLNNLGL